MNQINSRQIIPTRTQALKRTQELQVELGQTFNQRIKFQVWNRQTDISEKVWA